MTNVTVIIPTYGADTVWDVLAQRAFESAENQTVKPERIIRSHGDTLAEARNNAAQIATTEWLIFLDADDELDSGYIEAMFEATGDIRRPSTIGVYADGSTDPDPCMIPRKPIRDANFIVVSAMIRRQDFLDVGGFEEYPILEDWVLWQKMIGAGADVVDVPDAVYRIHVNDGGRNEDPAHGRVYSDIRRRFQ